MTAVLSSWRADVTRRGAALRAGIRAQNVAPALAELSASPLDEPDFDDDFEVDCHRDMRRHYVPELGARVTHRHVGSRCRIQVLCRYDPGLPLPNRCVQIGPVRYCEY
jgi:hypothetical protein